MKKITRYCQALDLVDNPDLIKEYEIIHQRIWPEVARHIRSIGVEDMQIWRLGTRLFMIMDVNEAYCPEKAADIEKDNPILVEWEQKMWRFQAPTPWTPKGEKWIAMTQLFSLSTQPDS